MLQCRSGRFELDYGHLAKKAVDFGPFEYRHHSKKALLAIHVCNVVTKFYSNNTYAHELFFILVNMLSIFV